MSCNRRGRFFFHSGQLDRCHSGFLLRKLFRLLGRSLLQAGLVTRPDGWLGSFDLLQLVLSQLLGQGAINRGQLGHKQISVKIVFRRLRVTTARAFVVFETFLVICGLAEFRQEFFVNLLRCAFFIKALRDAQLLLNHKGFHQVTTHRF